MAQSPYHYSEDRLAERQPLDPSIPSPPRHHYSQPYYDQADPYGTAHASPSRNRPGAHPDSAFERLRAERRYSREPPNGAGRPYAAATAAAAGTPHEYGQSDAVPPVSLPQTYPRSSPQHIPTTPGADNFGRAAAGGMAGIAMSVAEQNARESGVNSMHNPHYHQQGHAQGDTEGGMLHPGDYRSGDMNSHESLQGLSAAGAGTGQSTPGQRTPQRTSEIFMDDPYQNLSRHQDSSLGVVNPNDIEDDGDDGLNYGRKGPRTSMLSLGSSQKCRESTAAAAAAGGVVAGAVAGSVLEKVVARNGSGSVGNQYAALNNGAGSDGASGGSGGAVALNGGPGGLVGSEKGQWQAAAASKGNGRKWRLAIIFIIAILIIAGIVLGIVFGVALKDNGGGSGSSSSGSSSNDPTSTAGDDTKVNGDLGKDSDEIQALMNNPDLRKVFLGMDYTPLNAQYPDCIHNPPSQNNITRDMAVLSQLTNTVRLYGTDCNQTQMVIHAVDRLELKDKVKIWVGVWQDNNATTNQRQLDQMWDILDRYDESYFKGVIVANEILFREEMTITSLGKLLDEVRANMTRRGLSLPVATSDLGDKWTAGLAAQSDAIMANIHPFFAGTKASEAADWTMYFWGNKTQGFLKKDPAMNVIAETGWPSQGGTACGNEWETDCPDRAVAGIDELNIFMEDWVCRALKNGGPEYFWFEAFDEPWKIRYNTEGREWEDHWGLFDVNRNLKKGLKIPDCGGRRIPDL